MSQMKDQNLRAALIGTWRLISFELRTIDGDVLYPLGSDAQGFLTYTDQSFMSVQIMAVGRPEYTSIDPRTVDLAQLAAAAKGYLAYCGSFGVDEVTKEVHHHVTVSLLPNWIGDVQNRRVSLIDDRLELSTPQTKLSGQMQTAHLLWERLPSCLKS